VGGDWEPRGENRGILYSGTQRRGYQEGLVVGVVNSDAPLILLREGHSKRVFSWTYEGNILEPHNG